MDEHLTEEQLLQLALSSKARGAGRDATGARHLAACSICAARLVALRDELTESLLDSTADAPPAAPALLDSAHGLKAQVLQAAQPPTSAAQLQGFARRIGRLFDLDEPTVQRLLQDSLGDTVWGAAWPDRVLSLSARGSPDRGCRGRRRALGPRHELSPPPPPRR